MFNFFFNYHFLDIIFITNLLLIISTILIKLDPKLSNLINKITVEKRLYNLKLTLLTLILLFLSQIYHLNINLYLINTWDNLLYFWFSFFLLVYYTISYYYYKGITIIYKSTNFTSFYYTPTLNIHKIINPEYFISLTFLYILFCTFINVNDIIIYYFLFELINLIIYTIIGVNQNNPKAAESAISYYFISFISSLFCLWGTSYIYGFSGTSKIELLISLLYNINLYSYINHYGILLGFIYILLSFFIKLGIFPCHIWVPNIYEKLSNFNFLVLMTIIKFGFYIIMLQYLIHIIVKSRFYLTLFIDILVITSIGSIVFGSLLLITRVTVKGFLSVNSVISWGILNISFSSFFNSINKSNQELVCINIIHWNLQYIIIYINLIFIIYGIWLNWYLFIYWIKIFTIFIYNNNWLVYWLNYNLFKNINLYFYSNFINNALKSKIFITYRLTTLYYIYNKYNDLISILFIWLIGGFPPFILFLTKFYIIVYAWQNYLQFPALIVWFTINTLGIYGYMKGIMLITLKFNKEFYNK